MNSVVLTGNLATDVEVKELGDDRQVANFLLAVDRFGSEETDFFRVAAWNKQAELCGRYLAKGRRIGVDGRLRSSSWGTATATSGARSRSWLTTWSSSPRRRKRGSAPEVPFETAAV